MKRFSLLFGAYVLVGGASAAYAYSVSVTEYDYIVKWPVSSLSYQLDADGTPDISGTADLDAVRRGVKSWVDVTCSNLTFAETGTTTQTSNIITERVTDGINRIVWIDDSRWDFGSYVLGVTSPVYSYDGRIDEADIAFNGYSANWSTTGNDTDIESVAVHELGHFFGMQHVLGGENLSDPPTMSPAVDPYLRTRSLTSDDQRGVCFLYPQGSFTCTGATDCPRVVDVNNSGEEYYSATSSCSSGQCTGFTASQPGTTPLGGTCGTSNECVSGLFCQPLSNAGSYCAQSCTPGAAANCPVGFSCVGYSNSSGGACLPGDVAGCQCDTTNNCETGCNCDSDCAGNNCDLTTACDANCPTDPECCDKTTACDDNCPGDPECDKDGCAAMKGELPSGVLGLVVVGLAVARLRRRRAARAL